MRMKVEDLHFSYGNHEVLKGVSFGVENRGFVSLLGPNGAGKSTLFRCMLGLLEPAKGSVHICGRNIRNMPPAELSHRVAYIPQSHTPIFNFSVFDMVLMGTTAQLPRFSSPGKQQIQLAEAAMERMGIAHLRDRGCGNISGGERQLALIARAIDLRQCLSRRFHLDQCYPFFQDCMSLILNGFLIVINNGSGSHADGS